MILHHYANSPFSEKLRLIFGLKGLAWTSVTVPTVMPKPDVVALTGGFGRASNDFGRCDAATPASEATATTASANRVHFLKGARSQRRLIGSILPAIA